jgi:CelD/BcsL family acetyltransferase involved in cellulose biosynthesis
MHLSFTHDPAAFAALASEWNALLDRSATRVPFLRHEVQSLWWSTLGGGEWPGGTLWLGTGRDADEALVGVCPLFLPEGPAADGRLHLLGSFEISDYLDLIAPPERNSEMCAVLLEAVEAEPAVAGLDLYNLPEASPTLTSLESIAPRRGWTVTRERLQPCPVVPLDGGWETYLSRLDKKQRHELRRKMRRAEGSPAEVRLRLVSPQDDIQAEAESFLQLMAFDPGKAAFLKPVMRQHFLGLTHAASACGCLNLTFLDVGREPAAAYWCFDYDGRLWVYNSGLNPVHAALSPGWVLLGRLIQWAIDAGRREIDFLRGDEAYKFRLGGVERSIYRLTLTR